MNKIQRGKACWLLVVMWSCLHWSNNLSFTSIKNCSHICQLDHHPLELLGGSQWTYYFDLSGCWYVDECVKKPWSTQRPLRNFCVWGLHFSCLLEFVWFWKHTKVPTGAVLEGHVWCMNNRMMTCMGQHGYGQYKIFLWVNLNLLFFFLSLFQPLM